MAGLEVPVVPVDTLAALALGAGGAPGPRAVLLDARRDEVYAAAWSELPGEGRVSAAGADPAGGTAPDLLPASVYRPEELAARLPACALVVGEGARPAAEALLASRPDLAPLPEPAGRARAEPVGRLAVRLLAAGAAVSGEALVPRYVRRAEAEAQRTGEPLEPR